MVNRFLLILVAFIGCLSLNAQTVSNVSATQQGNELLVSYSLTTDNPCEVSLFVSLNGGKSWTGPLMHVSGDVGKNISAGSKAIRWQVLEEQGQLAGSGIHFKVEAGGKKSIEPEMVFVQGGRFWMGSKRRKNEKPKHPVNLSSFLIGKYEVTQSQWLAVMGNNPISFKGCDNCPVEGVSREDIEEFIQKLNTQTGKQYRLPTEAEWEFAARGGNESRNYTFSGSNSINSVAWFSDNSAGVVHPVGTKKPNELDIYDMSGNVLEPCSDWYDSYYNLIGDQWKLNRTTMLTNPKGKSSGDYKLLRGGSYNNKRQFCRSTFRNRLDSQRRRGVGLRLALSQS